MKSMMIHRSVSIVTVFIFVMILFPRPALPGGSFCSIIDARSNIYSAGHLVIPNPGGGGGGLFCGGLGISGIDGQVISFVSISGMVSGALGYPLHSADAWTGGTTDMNSYGGLAGLIVPDHSLCLVGVFLDNSEPVDPAPPRLDYAILTTGLTDYYPQLHQIFFIGDGLTGFGTGQPQRFHIPTGATWFYLGFADGWAYSGDPGYYDDNTGSLSVYAAVGSQAQISKMTLKSSSIKGGRKLKGTIQLRSAAPSAGVSIPIVSLNESVVLGMVCYINPGSKQGSFSLNTKRVSSTTKVKITAYSSNTASKTITVTK